MIATSTRQLAYDHKTRQFIAEISDTNGLHQLWPDSADLGMRVTSHVTGRSVDFVVTDEAHDEDGDLTYWALASVTGKRIDGFFTMTLYND